MKHYIINIFSENNLLVDYCRFIARHNSGTFLYDLNDFVAFTKSQKMQYESLYKNLTWERKAFSMGHGLAVYDKGKIICDIVMLNVVDHDSIDSILNKILKSDEDI